jgi:hypothetical protein
MPAPFTYDSALSDSDDDDDEPVRARSRDAFCCHPVTRFFRSIFRCFGSFCLSPRKRASEDNGFTMTPEFTTILKYKVFETRFVSRRRCS